MGRAGKKKRLTKSRVKNGKGEEEGINRNDEDRRVEKGREGRERRVRGQEK